MLLKFRPGGFAVAGGGSWLLLLFLLTNLFHVLQDLRLVQRFSHRFVEGLLWLDRNAIGLVRIRLVGEDRFHPELRHEIIAATFQLLLLLLLLSRCCCRCLSQQLRFPLQFCFFFLLLFQLFVELPVLHSVFVNPPSVVVQLLCVGAVFANDATLGVQALRGLGGVDAGCRRVRGGCTRHGQH